MPYTLYPATGKHFYNRRACLQHIEHEQGPKTIHFLGMRGIGKTSILRTLYEQRVSLYLSFPEMCGDESLFKQQVFVQLLMQRGMHAWLPEMSQDHDPFMVIQLASWKAAQQGHTLLLLFDEIEGLQDFDVSFLRKFGRLLSGIDPWQVVMTSAKNVHDINDRIRKESVNSPILFPNPLYLSGLEDNAAEDLICQSQSDTPLDVPSNIIAAIKEHTNNQPNFIQWLCHQLWQRSTNPQEWHITEDILHLRDNQLADRLRADFDYLSPQERRIVRAILHKEALPDDIPQERRELLVRNLTELGYLRKVDTTLQIGNTFLLYWFQDHEQELDWCDTKQQPSDDATADLYLRTVSETEQLRQRLGKFALEELQAMSEKLGQKPCAFISYAKHDNEHGAVTHLHEALCGAVQAYTGREFAIFDKEKIPVGTNEPKWVQRAMNEAFFFIAIMTPSFFNDAKCCNELELFLQREKELECDDLILPVHYIDCSSIAGTCKADVREAIAQRKRVEWHTLRHEDLNSPQVKQKVDEMAQQIRDRMHDKTLVVRYLVEFATQHAKLHQLHDMAHG